jgi:molybdenum cofactor cytidylyltransferase
MIAAIVPAAGRSARMGQPKLLLPFDGVPLIARVVVALRRGGVDRVVVVSPPGDTPGSPQIAAHAAGSGAEVLTPPTATADMRASVELGLDLLDANVPPEALLIAPGDCPGLDSVLVGRVIDLGRADSRSIVVPSARGRRGHPVLLPWVIAREIRRLPADVGINALLTTYSDLVVSLDWPDPTAMDDLDTPDDYRRWSSVDRPRYGDDPPSGAPKANPA